MRNASSQGSGRIEIMRYHSQSQGIGFGRSYKLDSLSQLPKTRQENQPGMMKAQQMICVSLSTHKKQRALLA